MSGMPPAAVWGRSAERIESGHRDRSAIVYVRQSSRQQVLDHSESTRLQYALVERAVALGWARSRVLVIDDDLRVSAAVADSRAGFARLVTEVTMGRAGLVLGIEMSRLARTGRDGHQLIELCCLSGCLLADTDGVYDPSYFNDRLLLGADTEAEREGLDRLWRQRLERAGHAADRARRQYQLAEPENRLVVRQLEKDWEAALAEPDRLAAEYRRFTDTSPKTLSPAEHARISALADDLPTLWHAPTTTAADRKELLRIVIDSVTVAVVGESELLDVTITWAGSPTTTGQATRPVGRLDQLSYYPRLVQRFTDLAAAGCSSAQIADALNAEGLRPPKRTTTYSPGQIGGLSRRLGVRVRHPNSNPRSPQNLGPDLWSVRELAVMLDMNRDRPQLDPSRLDQRPPGHRRQLLDHPGRPRGTRTPRRTPRPPT